MGAIHPSAEQRPGADQSSPPTCSEPCASCRQLTDAALMLVAATGVDSVDEQTLALRCERPVTIFDAHMGSAEACVLAAYDRIVDRQYAQWQEAFATSPSWADGMRSALQRTLLDLSVNFAALRLVTAEAQRGGPALRRRRISARARFVELLAQHDQRRHPRGPLPALQFELMLGAIHQAITEEFRAGRIDELPGQEERLLQLGAVFEPLLSPAG